MTRVWRWQKSLSPEEGSYLGPRAYCPLCEAGTSSPYERGFSVPEGLRRHLVGWGNTGACEVLEPIFGLAEDYWQPIFEKARVEAEIQRKARLEERRESERQFLLGPYEKPLLVDEALSLGGSARDAPSLTWAVDRLGALGFETIEHDSVRSFTKVVSECRVYADPRAAGSLTFYVYRESEETVTKRRKRLNSRKISFTMPDAWRNNLSDKFDTLLTKVIKDLPGRKRSGGSIL